MKTVFIISDFCAAYPGNFISSLKMLENKLSNKYDLVYFFRVSESKQFLSWYDSFSSIRECYLVPFTTFGAKDIATKMNVKRPSYVCFHFGGLSFPYSIFRRCTKNAKKECTFLLHVHSNPSFQKGIVPYVKRTIAKLVCPKSFVFVACSKEIFRILSNWHKRNAIYLSPNGFDYSRLSFSPGKAIPQNEHCAIMFGYDYHIKGVDIAASIAREYHCQDPAFHLYVVSAKNIDDIRKKISASYLDYNEYLSIIPPQQDIRSIYGLAQVYLLSSRTEGLPYSVLEASYSGLDVVASDLPCLKTHPSIPHLHTFPIGKTSDAVNLLKNCFSSKFITPASKADFEAFSLSEWASREWDIMEAAGHEWAK